MEQQKPLGHRPDIDGLRALAVIPVVMFHAGFGFPGGFVGVDVFFVISGFLITGILERDLQKNQFSFGTFWERRARRILPVLMVMLAFSLLCGLYLLLPIPLRRLGTQIVSVLASISNFRFVQLADYWAPHAESIPLLHTWSLAVEEQFYFVMPFALYFLHKKARNLKFPILATAMVLSFLLAMFWNVHSPYHFYMLPMRAWEMLIGALAALYLSSGKLVPRWIEKGGDWIGVALVFAASILPLNKGTPWPNIWTLLPTIGAVLILLQGTGKNPRFNALLCLPPLRFVGLISYSLYLWHWPLIVFYREYIYPDRVSNFEMACLITGAVALSALTWAFIEQPFRSKKTISFRPMVACLASSWIVLFGVSCLLSLKPSRITEFVRNDTPEAKMLLASSTKSAPYDATPLLRTGGLQFGMSNKPPYCVVLGSSHGSMMGPVIEKVAKDTSTSIAMLVQDGTCPLFAGNNAFVKAWESDNKTKRERDAIVQSLVSSWKPPIMIVFGRWDLELNAWAESPEASKEAFKVAFKETAAWLQKHASEVIFVSQVPRLPFDNEYAGQAIYKMYRRKGNSWPVFYEDTKSAGLRAEALKIFRTVPGVKILNPEPLFKNPNGSILYRDEQGLFYLDDDHLNARGALRMEGLLKPLFINRN